MTNKNVPKLRFPESTNQNRLSFTNYKVEKTTLKDILYSIIDFRGKTPKKLGLEWGGNIPALSAMNVKDGYIQFNEETHYGSEELYDAWMTQGDCKRNDIVMTLEAPMGNVAQIPDNNKYILSQRVILLKFNEKIVLNNYMYQYLRSPYFKKEMNRYATGTTAKGIKQKNLIKIKLKIPPLKEQEKIASFLLDIDKKIELLKDKKEEYVEFKHYLLQNLFPVNDELTPKLRFKMYDDEWSIKKIGDLFDNSSSNLSIDNLKDNFGDYKLYGATGLIKHIDFYEKDKTYIAIIKDGASVGKTFICDSNSSILGTLQYLEPKESFDFKFCYYLLNRVHFEKYKVGSTIPHIYFKDYAMEKISIPKKEEQVKISNILFNLDKKIDLLDQEIEYVEEYKKGLLQKMFI